MDNNKSKAEKDLLDDLEEALNSEDKLNLTNDAKDLEEEDGNVNAEFQNIMDALKGNGQEDQLLNKFMGDFLKGMDLNGNENPQEKLKETFGKIEGNPQFDQMADNMLMQLMEKEILQEPLQSSYESYNKYLDENKDTLNQEDYERYDKQRKCVAELLGQLEKEPNNKEKLINLFEEMQAQGDPPKEVLSVGSPFGAMDQPTGGDENCTIF